MASPTHNSFPFSGVAITGGAVTVTWISSLDTWLRIGASAVAIVSGIIVAVIAIKSYCRDK